jgi:hypothetical protein
MGDAFDRFKKTGKHYGAFDTDEAGAAFMAKNGGGQRGAAASKLPAGVTKQQALDQARAAIQAGKDPNAVRQRLQSFGIDPSGL